jgi:2-iminobutanoate/2-iminopropanoate deaminase
MNPITTPNAPQAIGPYSQAIVHNGLVYLSGQIPLDPASGQLIEGDLAAQTERVLANIAAVLEAAGSSPSLVLKTTVFLKNMSDFPKMNGAYARFFGDHRPARSTVEAARLPRDVQIEIDCIAAT